MKAKRSYSGLESFSLSFSMKKDDLLHLPGNDARMSRIHELFDAGREDEARTALRQALDDITRDLDIDRAGGSSVRSNSRSGDTVASLLLDLEF